MSESEKLRVTLAELERELASVEAFDEQLRERLEALRSEINEALERGEPIEKEKSQSLIKRLATTEQQFEGAHPTLAGVLRQLIDGLAQLGI